jgi:chaperonin GroEL (HSP60 family)
MTEEQQRVVVVRDDAPQNGREAQMHNIRAAKAVADTVRSTLGPAGMDKMMVDGHGDVIVTNDGATILHELDVAHPGAKMVIEMAKTQESVCYDGTTSTVVLGGQLLGNSEQLFQKGLHPNVVCRGFHQAAKWAVAHANQLPNGSSDLNLVAKTAMTGKAMEHSIEKASELCVNAVLDAEGDIERVRVVCQSGGSMEDSHLFPGIILHKEFSHEIDDIINNVLLVNTGLDEPKKEETANVHFASAREAKAYADLGNEALSTATSVICDALPQGGVVFTRDGAVERLTKPCAERGISVVSRVMDSDMKALSRLLDTLIVHEAINVTAEATADCVSIRQESIGGMKFVVIEQPPDQCPVSTLVLRGATRQTLDEHERGFEDAIGVVSLAFRDGKVVCGGGSVYISMAQHLRQRSADMGGREQMAVEAFAEALEVIPATIAENAGHDPLDTILALRNEHQNGKGDYGPDVETGGTCSMIEKGVFEPLSVITQAVLSATEVAISILRIDDIISKKMG